MRIKVELLTIVFIADGTEDVPDTVLTPIRRTLSAVKTMVPEANRTLNDVNRTLFRANRTLDETNRTVDASNRTLFGPPR